MYPHHPAAVQIDSRREYWLLIRVHHFYYTARRNGAAYCTICLANPTFHFRGTKSARLGKNKGDWGENFCSCNCRRVAQMDVETQIIPALIERDEIRAEISTVSFKSWIWKEKIARGRNLGHFACVFPCSCSRPRRSLTPLKGDATLVRARWAQKMFKKKPEEKGISLVPRFLRCSRRRRRR